MTKAEKKIESTLKKAAKAEKKVESTLKKLVLANVRTLEKAARKAAKGDYEELTDYLDDITDVKITIDRNFRYLHAEVRLTIGGPSLYFDSATSAMIGIWGGNRFVQQVDFSACDAVDDYFEDYYETCR